MEDVHLEASIRRLSPTRRSFHAGEILAYRGDRYTRLSVVEAGTVSARITGYDGKVLQVETFGPGDPIGAGILFASENVLPVELIAITPGTIVSIGAHALMEEFGLNQILLANFLRDAGDKIAFLAEKIRLFNFKTIRQKIAVYFLDLSSAQHTEVIRLPFGVETTAELFGVTRPALSRCLSELVREGILCREGKRFRLSDISALTDIAGT